MRIENYYFEYSSNIKINYKVIGSGKNNLVFIHGFGASLFTWEDIAKYFNCEENTLFFLDLLGHGNSSFDIDSDFSIMTQATVVSRFIKLLKISHPTIIGHSYGGSISLLVQQLYSEQVNINKLILIDVGAYPENIPFFIKLLRNPLTEYFLRVFIPKYFRAKFTLKKLFYNKSLVDRTKIINYCKFYSNKQWNALRVAAINIVPKDFNQFINQYSTINTPVLLIWGEKDPIFSLKIARKLNGQLQNSILEVIEQCGHIPNEEKPQETFEIINKFIKS